MKTVASGVALLPVLAASLGSQTPKVERRLEILTGATGVREVAWSAETHFEAPNWSHDGRSLLFNQGGRSERFRDD